jgi:hypothetical protein
MNAALRTSDAVDRVAMAGALLPLLVFGAGGDYERPEPAHFAALVAAIAGLAAVLTHRRWAGWFGLFAVLFVALRDHFVQGDHRASDVMLTTSEAVGVLFSGANPYAHVYQMTNPPGGLFGYPPGEIVFYALAHALHNDVLRTDLTCSILVLGIISALAPFCGPGLAALAISVIGWAPDVLFHLTDGSNDNAAAFLVTVGFAALVWSLSMSGRGAAALWWISAVAFGWSIAFKEYSGPIALFIALYLWRSDPARARGWITAAGATLAAFLVPFLIWNPGALIANVGGALVTHANIWGRNVWHDWISSLPNGGAVAPVIPAVTLAGVAALVAVLWRHRARTLAGAFLQGVVTVAALFVLARWTTSVYYQFLAPLAVVGVVMQLGTELYAPDAAPER